MGPTAGTRLRMKKSINRPKKKTQSMKNQVRSIKRILQNKNISAELREKKLVELSDLEGKINEKSKTEAEIKTILKFKKVKFFERKKLMRLLQKCKAKQKKGNSSESSQLEKRIEEYENDLKYIFFYPKGENYYALFPSKPHNSNIQQRQQELKKEAESKYSEAHAIEFQKFCTGEQRSKDTKVPKKSNPSLSAHNREEQDIHEEIEKDESDNAFDELVKENKKEKSSINASAELEEEKASDEYEIEVDDFFIP